MKTRSLILALLTLFAITFISCRPDRKDVAVRNLGTVTYYKDFPFKKYDTQGENHSISKTLKFDFNEFAKNSSQPIVFELFEKDSEGKSSMPEFVDLYINGTIEPNKTFTIYPSDTVAELRIESNSNNSEKLEGNHRLYLRVKDGGGLDYIDDTEITGNQTDVEISTQVWDVYNNVVMNPLAEGLMWGGVVLAIILVLSIIISRVSHPTFKIREFRIEYRTPEGELRPPDQSGKVILKGCYQAICSNKKPKQSVIAKIFKGKIAVAVDHFWEQEICFVPKTSSKNAIRIAKNNPYDSLVKSLNKGEPNEFVNSKNEKAIIQF
jgi:hypothetical protein